MSHTALPLALESQLLAGPAVPPPPGQVSDFGAVNEHETALIATSITFIVVAFGSVAVRYFTQVCLSDGLVLEDAFVIAAWTTNTAVNAVVIWMTKLGMGKPFWDMTLHSVMKVSKLTWIVLILYTICIASRNTGILLQLMRIFAPPSVNGRKRMACWALIVLQASFYTACVFAFALQRRLISSLWDPFAQGTCVYVEGLMFAVIAVSMSFDLIIISLSLPIILRFNMTGRRKLMTSLVFAIGILVSFSATGNLVLLLYGLKHLRETWWQFWQIFCPLMELTAGLLALCAPVTPRFLTHMGEKINRLNEVWFRSCSRPRTVQSSDLES